MNEERVGLLKRNMAKSEFHSATEAVRNRVEPLLNRKYAINGNEKGNWGHYYYCAHDGARLLFDWDSPNLHRCPACGCTYTGDPYDGAWVSLANQRLGEGIMLCGLLSAGLGERRYSTFAADALTAYAKYYPGYRTHGKIPYNGPGKLFAQTLDEAHWLIDLCQGYQLLEKTMSAFNQRYIEEGLFRPAARFLIEHKEKQLHNHAVLITSAISLIGLILRDEKILHAGLDGDYGLLDQLERGTLPEGFWYEGAFAYHFYCLYPILQFALAAEGTPWDIRYHAKLKRMFDFPLRFILPDGTFPSINDTSSAVSIQTCARYYEIALNWYGDEQFQELLQLAYGLAPWPGNLADRESFVPAVRSSIDALWCGLPLQRGESSIEAGNRNAEHTSDEGGAGAIRKQLKKSSSSGTDGLTKLVNSKGWYLLVKHSPFGGEHDHMDRLGISFGCGHKPLVVDPGTTAYSVPAHYDWFKHTYSHNTVGLNGKDQPPADGRRVKFHSESWGCWIESAVDWQTDDYRMRDFIELPADMCPWDDTTYAQAEFRRINAMGEDWMLDVVKVKVPVERSIDLLNHVSGELPASGNWRVFQGELCELGSHLFHDARIRQQGNIEYFNWVMKGSGGTLKQASWCSQPAELLTVKTPDNPPNAYRQSLIQRTKCEGEVVFVNAFCYQPSTISDILPDARLKMAVYHKETLDCHVQLTGEDFAYSFGLEWKDGSQGASVTASSRNMTY